MVQERLKIGHEVIHSTDYFTAPPYFSKDQERVFGYKDSKRLGVALYPAFRPLADYVLSDLEILFEDNIDFSDAAKAHIAKLRSDAAAFAALEVPDIVFRLSPFEHQREGLSRMYHSPRYALFLDMGLGKTKVTVDLLRAIGQKTLIVCPAHLVSVWGKELVKSSFEGELTWATCATPKHQAMSPEERLAQYTGRRAFNPPASSRFAGEHPDLYYVPLAAGLPAEVYELEDAYVQSILADDAKARTSLRGKLRRRADKLSFYLPNGTWRLLAPAPPGPLSDKDIYIVSYALAKADIDLIFAHFPYTTIIADESHAMGNTRAQQTKAMWKLGDRAARRHILSGTPALGNPMHLFGQLRFLSPALIGNYRQFVRRYIVKASNNSKIVVGYKNLQVLNSIMEDVSFRKKIDECIDLPEQTLIEVDVPVDEKTRALYNDLVATWSTELFTDHEVEVEAPTDRINKLLQILSGFYIDTPKKGLLCDGCPRVLGCAETRTAPYTQACRVPYVLPTRVTYRLETQPRLEVLENLLDDLLVSEEHKVIIWCAFTEEVEMVCELLEKRGVEHVRVDGRTTNKQACVDRLNEDPKCRAYVSMVSISEGITLNEARYMIFYGLTYDLRSVNQALRRNWRIGQEKRTIVYTLVTPGSVQEAITRSYVVKDHITRSMTDFVRCTLCAEQRRCGEEGVSPFQPGCIYTSEQRRVVTRPAMLY